jgi:Arc/MetJ-type ribon-helix-helix transcriptional regulator
MPTIHKKVVPIMLTHSQIAVVDAIVEYGEYNGRSHAIREILLPVLDAAKEAINTGKGYQATLSLQVAMKKAFGEKMDLMAENSKDFRDSKGQVFMDLEGVPKIELKLAS